MLTLIAILLLAIAALFMIVVRLLRPGFSFYWLATAGTALISWTLALLAYGELPFRLALGEWQPGELFPASPALFGDAISWSFTLALVTLLLTAILTDTARMRRDNASGQAEHSPGWSDWMSNLALTAVGMLAILAGNLLTLLIAWVVLDLLECILWLSQARNSQESERAVILLTTRLAGVAAVWSGILMQPAGTSLEFGEIGPSLNTFLIIAAGLRLGVLPVSALYTKGLPRGRSLATMLRLAPSAVNLSLLVRAAAVGISPGVAPYLLVLAGLAALYGGFSWVNAADELDGLNSWIIGMGALALASAIRGQPEASLAWSLALLSSGGILFLYSLRRRWLFLLLLVGALGFSTLPFTPAWQGVLLYAGKFYPAAAALLIAQGALLAGYLRHALRPVSPINNPERWVWLIYPWGLALLSLAQWIAAWWSRPLTIPTLYQSAAGLAGLFLSGVFMLLGRNKRQAFPRLAAIFRNILSLDWFYRLAWRLYKGLRRLALAAEVALEGPAGFLWALLLLTLLASLLTQLGLGG